MPDLCVRETYFIYNYLLTQKITGAFWHTGMSSVQNSFFFLNKFVFQEVLPVWWDTVWCFWKRISSVLDSHQSFGKLGHLVCSHFKQAPGSKSPAARKDISSSTADSANTRLMLRKQVACREREGVCVFTGRLNRKINPINQSSANKIWYIKKQCLHNSLYLTWTWLRQGPRSQQPSVRVTNGAKITSLSPSNWKKQNISENPLQPVSQPWLIKWVTCL